MLSFTSIKTEERRWNVKILRTDPSTSYPEARANRATPAYITIHHTNSTLMLRRMHHCLLCNVWLSRNQPRLTFSLASDIRDIASPILKNKNEIKGKCWRLSVFNARIFIYRLHDKSRHERIGKERRGEERVEKFWHFIAASILRSILSSLTSLLFLLDQFCEHSSAYHQERLHWQLRKKY